jgi:hypothetical protein
MRMTERQFDSGKISRPYEEGMTIEEQGVVYGCFNEGLTVSEIQGCWSGLIGRDPLSNRQLYLYRERWVKAGRKNEIDEIAIWTEREAFKRWDVQPDHMHILNDLNNWMMDEFRGFLPKPTYRLLYWCSYVLNLAPELQNELDIFMFGSQLTLQDIAYYYSGKSRESSDLDDLLSYRPWRSSEKQEKYRAAQIRGEVFEPKEIAPILTLSYRIQPINSGNPANLLPRSTQTSVSMNDIPVGVGRQMLLLGMVHNMSLYDGFKLPSVKVSNLKQEGINPVEINFSEESGSIVRIRF